MEPSLLEQGLSLMLVGLGTVFVFLGCLVAATMLMSTLLRRFEPAEQPGAGSEAAPHERQVTAAIAVAIHRHRRRRPR